MVILNYYTGKKKKKLNNTKKKLMISGVDRGVGVRCLYLLPVLKNNFFFSFAYQII